MRCNARSRKCCAPQIFHPGRVLRRNALQPARHLTSALRWFLSFGSAARIPYGSAGVARRSTRGASRPARISLARAHPVSMDVGIRASERVQILREGLVPRVQARCADARRCSEQPTRAGSSGDEDSRRPSCEPKSQHLVDPEGNPCSGELRDHEARHAGWRNGPCAPLSARLAALICAARGQARNTRPLGSLFEARVP
jgi:hypothetical protein